MVDREAVDRGSEEQSRARETERQRETEARRETEGRHETKSDEARSDEAKRGTEGPGEPRTTTGRGETDGLKARGSKAVQEVRRDAKREMEKRVGRGSTRAAEKLDPMTAAIRTAADELEGRGEGWMARRARGVAGGLERMQRYLKDGDADAMMSDLERQAREHPAMFLGTAFAAGLGLGRFLRASDRNGENGELEAADGRGDAFDTDTGTTMERERRGSHGVPARVGAPGVAAAERGGPDA